MESICSESIFGGIENNEFLINKIIKNLKKRVGNGEKINNIKEGIN